MLDGWKGWALFGAVLVGVNAASYFFDWGFTLY